MEIWLNLPLRVFSNAKSDLTKRRERENIAFIYTKQTQIKIYLQIVVVDVLYFDITFVRNCPGTMFPGMFFCFCSNPLQILYHGVDIWTKLKKIRAITAIDWANLPFLICPVPLVVFGVRPHHMPCTLLAALGFVHGSKLTDRFPERTQLNFSSRTSSFHKIT